MNVEWYQHHGRQVAVQTELKGNHRAHCLCYECKSFQPSTPNTPSPCPIAAAIYKNCVEFGVVTPVYECPEFFKK